jgi:hypothetical protein
MKSIPQRQRRVVILVLAVLVSVSAGSASAWNDRGHRIVAVMAYDRLEPEQRVAIVSVLRQHPRFAEHFDSRMPPEVKQGGEQDQGRWLFSQAAIWPDFVRGVSDEEQTLFNRGTWHYVNHPVYLHPEDRELLEFNLPVNISTDYPTSLPEDRWNIVQALKRSRLMISDPSLPAAERAVAICWLFHLTGDSHQPLHSVALFSSGRFPAGDRGGNSILVRQGTNLHALWDGLLGRDDRPAAVAQQAALFLNNDEMSAIGEAGVGVAEFEQWLQESRDIAREVVYDRAIRLHVASNDNPATPLSEIEVSNEYLKNAGHIAQKRVVEAAFRLAAEIERDLDD